MGNSKSVKARTHRVTKISSEEYKHTRARTNSACTPSHTQTCMHAHIPLTTRKGFSTSTISPLDMLRLAKSPLHPKDDISTETFCVVCHNGPTKISPSRLADLGIRRLQNQKLSPFMETGVNPIGSGSHASSAVSSSLGFDWASVKSFSSASCFAAALNQLYNPVQMMFL